MFWNIQEYFQDEDIFGMKFSKLLIIWQACVLIIVVHNMS
jgi:hypothetical protein